VLDIVSVGHFSIDSISLPGRSRPFTVLGGSPTYVSLVSRCLDARVGVVSKIGSDFPNAYLWWLREEGVDLSGVVKVEQAKSTSFELKYSRDLSDRSLRLRCRAPSIAVTDLPDSLKAKAIHVAPIAGEITYDVVQKLRNHAEVLSIDPQGLVRNFDEVGNITLGPLTDKRILELVNIYKSSLAEVQNVTSLQNLNSAIKAIHDHGVEVVIVTLGMKGVIVSAETGLYNIPACKPEKVVDPTGSGDAFMGGFLVEYINGANYLRCACVGSAAASLVVEAAGPTFSSDKEEIHQRARELYEKEIKE